MINETIPPVPTGAPIPEPTAGEIPPSPAPAETGAVPPEDAAPSSPDAEAKAEKLDAEQASEAAKRLNERRRTTRERIDQLTWEKRELERRAVSAESRLQDLEKRSAQRPDPSQYTDPAKYEYDDRAAQAADLRRHEVKLEVEDTARHAALAQVQVWQARCEEYAADVPDFKTVTDNPNIPINVPMAQAIMDLEDGPAIAYHLAKNPAIAAHIANMTPRQMDRELGRISGRLAQTPLRRVTQAPPPPATVQGRSGSSSPDLRKAGSMEEYARIRNAEIKAERR